MAYSSTQSLPLEEGNTASGNAVSTGGTKAHFQTTLSSDRLNTLDVDTIDESDRSRHDRLHSPSGPSRERSPDPVGPPSLPRLQSSLRTARFTDPPSVEQSPVIRGMNTVPEDEIVPGDVTPNAQRRKSVQFSRSARNSDEAERPKEAHTPVEGDKADQTKVQSLYSKLRALAASQGLSHIRSASGISTGGRSADGRDSELPSAKVTDTVNGEVMLPATLEEEDSQDDADEESAAEGHLDQTAPRKKRRKVRRQAQAETAPSSPYTSMPSGGFWGTRSTIVPQSPRPSTLVRSATDTDLPAARQGLSEDEGRKRLDADSPLGAWTPRHPLRGLSYGGQRRTPERNSDRTLDRNPDGPAEGRRPLTLLNLGAITSHRGDNSNPPSGTETPKPSRRKLFAERGSTLSAAKWRQIKNSLRAFGQSKKRERTQDQKKSAELLAELAAGGPAALMVASMFQRDEHGRRRVPVLLEQLKVNITDSEITKFKEAGNATPGDKHMIFRIELEYGSGGNRMKWMVRRSLRDFAALHSKYKLHYQSEKLRGRGDSSKEMPKFPKSVFPFLKGIKGLDDEEEGDNDAGNDVEAAGTDPDRSERPDMGSRQRSRAAASLGRRFSGMGDGTPTTPGGTLLFGRGRGERDRERDQRYPERQRKKLEDYLQGMIKFMLFRADANRLCKFLELSALGMRLASEGSYHGKEGFLLIRSAKGLDFRKSLTPSNVKNRHTPKWFLVRHSYIVCVDSPEAMHIYDVFLFDSDFSVQSSRPTQRGERSKKELTLTAKGLAASAKETAKHPQHHRLKIQNSERRLKLLARNERMLFQFEESIRNTAETSPWCKPNRFGSFAPVRERCFAQWLVDGRDHMWVVSRAISQAKDVIYIHDWWLSPELYMRRPAAISQRWRLDRLLKEKAEQGVKIFVIVYRNIDAAIPIDSQYTKFSLLDLHPNIFVQRSPNQFRQNTFFWAHHEKLCIIDHTIAFVGGIDLCFGRWDTPQHILTDHKDLGFDENKPGPRDADHCQLWPGKDYSNPRVQDFFALNKPFEEMYDRFQVARMPWHDISMQVVGQPARDLTRHFVQRWNYILRQRKPTRPTPFLLPPPDFRPADLEALGLDGTCEVQLLRSAGPWSLGTPDKTEHSIMDAYVKMIEESEHFVYIENQFFISSCETEGATVMNQIGDALVERVTRADRNGEAWRAVIVIPLIPGFQNTVEQEGGTSVRLIMQYQYRSICRGESSIFGRLKHNNIEPEDYIQFYSLRQWGKIGPRRSLVTEQLYIHAKCIIADDRVALIGSANINERSQLGNRDSEVAAIVRDADMIWSRMNGQPYQVGRFAHSLRMRLMREHLGLDVDQIMEDAQAMEAERRKSAANETPQRGRAQDDNSAASLVADLEEEDPLDRRGRELQEELLGRNELLQSFNHDVDWEQADNPNLKTNRKVTEDSRVTGTEAHKKDIDGEGWDNMKAVETSGWKGARDTHVLRSGREVLLRDLDSEGKKTLDNPVKPGDATRLPSYVVRRETPNPPLPPRPSLTRASTADLGLPQLSQLPALPEADDTDIGGPPMVDRFPPHDAGTSTHPLFSDLRFPMVDRDCMQDPIHDAFIDETWHQIAMNNTKIYRAIFRCMPDNLVRDWTDYHQYVAYEQRFDQLQGKANPATQQVSNRAESQSNKRTGPPGVGTGAAAASAHIKALSKVPVDLEKKSGDIKDVLKSALSGSNAEGGREGGREGGVGDKEKVDGEKEALKSWAAEANRAQMQRQGSDLTVRKFPSLDEKAGLQTVPEHDPMAIDGVAPGTRSSQESDTAKASSSDTAIERGSPATVTGAASSHTGGGSAAASPTTTAPPPQFVGYSDALNMNSQPTPVRRRRRATTRGSRKDFNAADDIISLAEAEELLNKVQGHLVEWPYDWLDKVEAGSNWLFPFDQMSPIEIYI